MQSAYPTEFVPQCGVKHPTTVLLINALADRVTFITEDGRNVAWYSSSENITMDIFQLGYSDCTQWIAIAASVKVCAARDW